MQPFPEFNLKFSSVTVVPKYMNFAIFSKELLPISKGDNVLHFGEETQPYTQSSLYSLLDQPPARL